MNDITRCNKCEKISLRTSFYENKNNKDGYLKGCKKFSKYYTI